MVCFDSIFYNIKQKKFSPIGLRLWLVEQSPMFVLLGQCTQCARRTHWKKHSGVFFALYGKDSSMFCVWSFFACKMQKWLPVSRKNDFCLTENYTPITISENIPERFSHRNYSAWWKWLLFIRTIKIIPGCLMFWGSGSASGALHLVKSTLLGHRIDWYVTENYSWHAQMTI